MKNFVRLSVVLIVFICLQMVACTVETEETKEVSPLIGVWELVHGDWNLQDSIDGSDITVKSMKFYSESHFYVIGKGDEVYSLSGTYTYEGNECIEKIGLSTMDMSMNREVKISFSIEDDMLSLESDWFKEKWKRVE